MFESFDDRSALADGFGNVDDAELRIAFESIDDAKRVVGAAVENDDKFEMCFVYFCKIGEIVLKGALDALFFIICRYDDAEFFVHGVCRYR